MINVWAYSYVDENREVRSGALAGCSLAEEPDARIALMGLHGARARKADIRKIGDEHVSNWFNQACRRELVARRDTHAVAEEYIASDEAVLDE